MNIKVRKAGLLTTVQDLGRYRCAHLGISPAGAVDRLSFRIANLLVGNDENAPALEMTLTGASLEFETAGKVALAGAECESKLGPYAVPNKMVIEVPAGGVLECGAMKSGARAYLAVEGGFEVPLVMGSASTHIGDGFGGIEGRKLRAGDVLQVGRARSDRLRSAPPAAFDRLLADGPVRVTPGPQQGWFAQETLQNFCASVYAVTSQSNRSGLRLEGPILEARERAQLLTEGTPLGAIQVPSGGQPIVLLVDQQTTGGYPKIANVIAADIHRIAQLRPGEPVRFAQVTIDEAVRSLDQQEQQLREIFES